MTNALFSFGTLRQTQVQQSLFGRLVPSSPDRILGYRIGRVKITDPAAIETSGSDVHPALIATGQSSDVVEGEVLELTDNELAAVHRYEQVSFECIRVETASGAAATAYVPKSNLSIF